MGNRDEPCLATIYEMDTVRQMAAADQENTDGTTSMRFSEGSIPSLVLSDKPTGITFSMHSLLFKAVIKAC